jgi:hypothetical protein
MTAMRRSNRRGKRFRAPVSEIETRSSLWTRLKRIGAIISVLLALATISGYFLPPTIETPSAAFPDNPFSLVFEIKNENILPLLSIDYSCELPRAHIGGWKITGAQASGNGPQAPPVHYGVLWGRSATSGRCEYGFNVPSGVPVKDAKYRLSVRYWSPPVPYRRTREVDFVAILDTAGKVYRWVPE